jgi:hypothetical protein
MIALVSDHRYRRETALAAPAPGRRGQRVNPNVMFEIGYARGLDLPTILIAESAEQLPFDISVDRTIEYGGRPTADWRNDLLRVLAALRGRDPDERLSA